MEEKKQLINIELLADAKPLCALFHESGIFEDIKSEAQAIVKVMAGREIGLSPLESMMNLYIVKNRVAANSKVVSSLIKKSKKYDYSIETLTDEVCTIVFYILKEGEAIEIGKSTFTTKDAAKAGLINGNNWKNYPRNMLFARAISNGARWYTPDVYSGYIQEELEGIVDEPKLEIVTIDDNDVKKEGNDA